MAFLKYAILASSLLAPTFAQEPQPLPQIGPDDTSGDQCSGCYVVADVAAVAFASEVLVQTNTVGVDVQSGKNGTYTSTRVIQGTIGGGHLSLSTQGQFGGGGLAPYTMSGSLATVGGAILTSPTAYQVFTAYSVTSSFKDDKGNCQTVSGEASTPSEPFSTVIPANPDQNYILAAESSFIAHIGLSCSAGGQAETPVIIAPIITTTTYSTSVRSLSFTPPQPAGQPTQTPIGTGSGNFTTFTGASISPYVPGGAGATFSTPFSQSTLPLMAVGSLTILVFACVL